MVRRWAAAMAVVGAAMAAPATADAGGFATVGLSSHPDGVAPGAPWRAELTILAHGRTPASGLKPTVRITSAGGRATRSFAATPTARPGVYRVQVVFPTAGRWRYAVDDGYSQTHTFAPVRIGAGAPVVAAAPTPAPVASGGAGGGADLGVALGAAAAAGLLAGGLTAAARRRRGRPGATAPATR
ncbi:MAG: hypothetical protein QOD55_666 [Solirubrobacteraceae bacterium]|nr:hypothetical protein [Solirubrobacteraceae bacterium]